MRKRFYIFPPKEVEVTLTFAYQGYNSSNKVVDFIKEIETTILRRDMERGAKEYANASMYRNPQTVVQNEFSNVRALLLHIKSPKGETLWINPRQEI